MNLPFGERSFIFLITSMVSNHIKYKNQIYKFYIEKLVLMLETLVAY